MSCQCPSSSAYVGARIDQDLGWCVGDDAFDPWENGLTMQDAFEDTPCASTSCGVMRQGVECPFPTPRPTVAPTVAPTATRGSDTVDAAYRLSGASAALLVLALAA